MARIQPLLFQNERLGEVLAAVDDMHARLEAANVGAGKMAAELRKTKLELDAEAGRRKSMEALFLQKSERQLRAHKRLQAKNVGGFFFIGRRGWLRC